MKRIASTWLAGMVLALGWAVDGIAGDDDASPAGLVVVRPKASDAILANPGIGWETFHRPAKQDRSLPTWIPSTLHYARWGWGVLEPEPGKIDCDFLDRELRQSRESGQQYAFRVMCCSTSRGQPYHPAWLKTVGAKELQAEYGKEAPFPIPDMDDPVVLEKHLDFIRRLGARYDGHPDIDHIDLGSIGWWGEWHLSGSKSAKLPTLENRKRVVDAYLAAFPKTPIVMLIGGRECLTYAAQHGAGWRADCLGDMGGFSRQWCHMRKGYPGWIRESHLQDVWKTAPVAWETCWDMRKWVGEGWSLRYIFNYALAMHGSCINNKSAPLPEGDDVRPELERFLRRLGYRLVLSEVRYPASVGPSGKLDLAMKWRNCGSAPCYRPYRLAYRLIGDDGAAEVLPGNVTVNRWLPGSVDVLTDDFLKSPPDLPPGPVYSVSDTVALSGKLKPGVYALSLAVVNDRGDPVVKLGIQGRSEDGWYPLGKLSVGK